MSGRGVLNKLEHHPFNVTSEGVVQVLGEGLDYEAFSETSVPRFEFSVTAYDGEGLGSAPARVFVSVLNENDHTPEPVYASEWPLKEVELEWGTRVSSEAVFTLHARDQDRGDSLFYSITGTSFHLPFAILDINSGSVILHWINFSLG